MMNHRPHADVSDVAVEVVVSVLPPFWSCFLSFLDFLYGSAGSETVCIDHAAEFRPCAAVTIAEPQRYHPAPRLLPI